MCCAVLGFIGSSLTKVWPQELTAVEILKDLCCEERELLHELPVLSPAVPCSCFCSLDRLHPKEHYKFACWNRVSELMSFRINFEQWHMIWGFLEKKHPSHPIYKWRVKSLKQASTGISVLVSVVGREMQRLCSVMEWHKGAGGAGAAGGQGRQPSCSQTRLSACRAGAGTEVEYILLHCYQGFLELLWKIRFLNSVFLHLSCA